MLCSRASISILPMLPPELAAALDTRIEPVQKPKGYRLAAAGVMVGMVLLPLIYVAFVAGLAWGVGWYATHAHVLFEASAGFLTLILYFGPIIAGGMTVLFMVKPLFAPRRKTSEPVSLTPQDEPTLFAFVERLAEVVGAPAPSRIDVDCRANASAGFRRGLFSMFGNDLVLTIGLPLADNLTVRQLAGVLAHEFGHFTQGGGMRLTYIVERISQWFHRVVYERDVFDDKLENAVASGGGWFTAILALALRGVALGRWLLQKLMVVGQRLSRGLLRQMEFDADRYEVRVAGVDSFETTTDRIVVLGVAEQHAYADLAVRARDRRLPDDLPRLIAATDSDIPDEATAELLDQVHAARTGPLDTHPAVADRVESARREGGSGLAWPDESARTLFVDFDGLCRRSTTVFYEQVLSPDASPMEVVSTQQTLEDRAAEVASTAAMGRLLMGVTDWPILGRDFPPSMDDVADPAVVLSALRDRLVALAPDAQIQAKETSDEYVRLVLARQAQALAKSAVRFRASDFGLERPTAGDADAVAEAAIAAHRAARRALRPFHEGTKERVALALMLEAAQAEPSVALGSVTERLGVLAALEDERDALEALHLDFACAVTLLNAVMARQASSQVDEYLSQRALELVAKVRQRTAKFRAHFESVAYPFQHGAEDMTLAEYLVERIPDSGDINGIIQTADAAVSRFAEVRGRIWGTLARTVEHIESAYGLAPLPAPPPEPAETEGTVASPAP